VVKQLLTNTKFNQLDCFEHMTDETNDDNNLLIRNYYGVDIAWQEPNFYCDLRFIVDLDLLTLAEDDVAEENDSLLVPLYTRYALG
jgi:hypothetical protein